MTSLKSSHRPSLKAALFPSKEKTESKNTKIQVTMTKSDDAISTKLIN